MDIELVVAILLQSIHENLILRGGVHEQRHAGLEFQIIRVSQDLIEGWTSDLAHQFGALRHLLNSSESLVAIEEKFIAHFQVKRDGSQRGTIEITSE